MLSCHDIFQFLVCIVSQLERNGRGICNKVSSECMNFICKNNDELGVNKTVMLSISTMIFLLLFVETLEYFRLPFNCIFVIKKIRLTFSIIKLGTLPYY